MPSAANPYRDQRTQYDPGMGMDELCDALNLGLYIGVNAPSGASPTISSAIISFLQSGTGARATDQQTRGRKVVYVTDFYADGSSGVAVDNTGSVDSTAGIQAAIDSLTAGGEVVFPRGTYKITSAIQVRTVQGITLRLDGATINSASSNAFHLGIFSAPAPEYRLQCRITGRGTIVGDTGTPANTGIYIDETAECFLDNITVKGFSKGIEFNGGLLCDFYEVFIRENTTGVYSRGTANFQCNSNVFRNCKLNSNNKAFDVIGGSFYLKTCDIEGNTAGAGVDVCSFTAMTGGGSGTGLSVEGCWFEGNTGANELYFTGSAAQRSVSLIDNKMISSVTGSHFRCGTCSFVIIGGSYNASGATGHLHFEATTFGMVLGASYDSAKLTNSSSNVVIWDPATGEFKTDVRIGDGKKLLLEVASSASVHELYGGSGNWLHIDADSAAPGIGFLFGGNFKASISSVGKLGDLPTTNGPCGTVTLTANAASTTVNNTAVTASSLIFLFPTSANAAADLGSATSVYISAKVASTSFTITHPNNANADKTFNYWIVN